MPEVGRRKEKEAASWKSGSGKEGPAKRLGEAQRETEEVDPRKRKVHREAKRCWKAGFLPPTPREGIDSTEEVKRLRENN